MELDLALNGSARILLIAPNATVWCDTDLEGLRHLHLMLDAMLEDFDKVTLGVDRLQDVVDTEPL